MSKKEEILYRIEFSEAQQWLRQDRYRNTENTNGFITIADRCTDKEFKIFESFLTRSDGKLIRNSMIKYRNADVMDSYKEMKNFINSLNDYGLRITY